MWYILDKDKNPVKLQESDYVTFSEFMACDDNRIIEQTTIGEYFISTVFLGIDHGWSEGPPLLFETMVFKSGESIHMDRCHTWEQAKKMHKKCLSQHKAITSLNVGAKIFKDWD